MTINSINSKNHFSSKNFEQLLVDSGLVACLRCDAMLEWGVVSNKVVFLPVAYTSEMIEYQHAYFRRAEIAIDEISLVLFNDNRPCAIWPLSLKLNADEPIGSNGGAILPPIFISGFSKKSEKKILKSCLVFLDKALKSYKGSYWRSSESFRNMTGISKWHQHAMEQGAVTSIQHDLYVDLLLPIDTIKASFRKSYKPLITSGNRLWEVSVLDHADASVWAEFVNLHKVVSGRVTRSAETWELQYHAIENGDAFLVYLRDDDGRMVGGGLFYITANEGLYAVAAYDRELFDKPLGHVVQFHAIEEMKKRGLQWYCIGRRFYPSEEPTPKEISISEFKQGFATHIFPNYCLKYEI